MKNNRWFYAIIALIAGAVLAIGGVVFYGTSIMPGQRVAADKQACDTFAAGLIAARTKAVQMLEQTPPAKDPDVAQAYLDAIDVAIDKAFTQAASRSDVANALAQLGLARISYDATQGFTAIGTLENSYDPVKTACSVVEPTSSPTASPAASPTASN